MLTFYPNRYGGYSGNVGKVFKDKETTIQDYEDIL